MPEPVALSERASTRSIAALGMSYIHRAIGMGIATLKTIIAISEISASTFEISASVTSTLAFHKAVTATLHQKSKRKAAVSESSHRSMCE